MSDITRQTLAFSIFSITFNRRRLIDRINTVSDEIEEDEHLCDTLIQMEKALTELEELYAAYKTSDLDSVEAVQANAEEDYKQFCAEQRKLSAA